MIMIIDFSQVCISAIMTQVGRNIDVDENLLRHICLMTLRTSIKKFKKNYPEIVIACDNRNYWRRDVYPYYKASRRENIKKSDLDWKLIFDTIHTLKRELKEYFPYRVMECEKAEADDIIASICFRGELLEKDILIVSGDKDFIQLQRYENVRQYDPVRKRWLRTDDAFKFLQEHVLKGDAGDGIPNVMSDDKTFIEGRRQKPLTTKRMETILSANPESLDSDISKNLERNQTLIDLTRIPSKIQKEINNSYDQEMVIKDKSKLMNYMVKHKLHNLIEYIQDF